MMCMSMPISQLDGILDQLLLIWPQIYDYHLPPNYASNQKLLDLVAKKHVTNPVKDRLTLKTNNGQELYAFHKTPGFGADLYGGMFDDN